MGIRGIFSSTSFKCKRLTLSEGIFCARLPPNHLILSDQLRFRQATPSELVTPPGPGGRYRQRSRKKEILRLPSPVACIKERSPALKGMAPPHRPRGRASIEVYSSKLAPTMGPTTRLSDRGQTLSHQHNPSSYNVPDAATLSSYIRSNISRMNADSNPGFEPPQPLSSNAQKEQMTE
eukprot:scaffold26153_cov18-Tisochrysis_lutea.AAC.2